VDVTAAQPVVARAVVRLATRFLPDPESASNTAEEMKRRWDEARAAGASATAQRIALTRYQGAEITAAMARHGLAPELEVFLTALGLGPCAWVHLPVEPFASLALQSKKASPFEHTRVIGYTDDYAGYVTDEVAHETLVYEAMASIFGPEAGRQLVDAAVDLLGQTKKSMS
jgi:hypothetical protein